MSIKERIRISMLIEKMNRHISYSEKLGLENKSKLHGKTIEKERRDKC